MPVTDGTTGTVVVEAVPGFDYEITGGTAAGSNLFHSFDQFSVPSGSVVTFLNDNSSVQTVLNRVTGAAPSIVDGLITTGGLSPEFDLFLLNPNGIIFGPGGALDVRGSFLASTGQGIEFGSQGIFSADTSTSSNPALLTVAPSAFLFSQMNAAQPLNSVEVSGSFLSVPTQQSLVLLGGNPIPTDGATGGVLIDGALLDAQSGRVEIAALGGEGRVGLGSDYQLNIPQNTARADVLLQNSFVDVSDFFDGPGGGTAQIQGGEVSLIDSVVYAENYSGGQGGGGITIRANELNLDNAAVQAITYSPAAGGNVLLDISQGSGQLVLANGSVVSAETDGPGAGGNVTLRANAVELLSGSGLGTETRSDADAGRVEINTQTLRLVDGFLSANTFGAGRGGSISINAMDRVELTGFSTISANADDFNPVTGTFVPGAGDAGSITLSTNQLNIQGGGRIEASTLGNSGAGGQILVRADTATISGLDSGIFSQVEFGSPSPGGTIEIDAGVLRLQEGAQIKTSTEDSAFLGTSGSAGNIIIRNTALVEITGQTVPTGLLAEVGDPTTGLAGITGSGGTIEIDATELRLIGPAAVVSSSTADAGRGGDVRVIGERLLVQDGAQIQAATLGFAPGGNIVVNAGEIELVGAGATAPFAPSALVTSTLGDAPAGNIAVTANRLSVQGGARLSASSDGAGSGGSLQVTAADQVVLVGRGANSASGLFVEGRGTGAAGTVVVNTPLLQLDGGQIVAATVSDDGGNIQLRVPLLLLLDNQALISATAGTNSGAGNGGNIDIDTAYLVAIPFSDSDIVANAFLGQGGNIQISALGIFQIAPGTAIPGNGANDIDASSDFGTDGTVTIDQPNVDPSRGLNSAPPAFVDGSQLVAQGCLTQGSIALNRLILTGRGGIALDPGSVPSASSPFVDLGVATTASAGANEAVSSGMAATLPQSAPAALPTEVIEAQGWVTDDQGEVTLVAAAPQVVPHGGWDSTPLCTR